MRHHTSIRDWALALTCLLSVAASCGALQAAPPTLVSATPDHADVEVDPALKEMRFVFDQAMETSGFSICGGGALFPRLAGKPRWQDDHTLVVNVELEPDHEYTLSLNCASATNFRNRRGEPLDAYPIRFRTAANSEAAKAHASDLSADALDQVFRTLGKAIDERYSYRDRLKVNWTRELSAARAALGPGCTPSACARRIALLLAVAQDPHIRVEIGGIPIGSYRRSVQPNVSSRTLMKLVPKLEPVGPKNSAVAIGRFDDGVVYVLIAGWEDRDGKIMNEVVQKLSSLADAPGFVIDVRSNGGGDELLARKIAALFVQKTTVYSRSLIRDPQARSESAGQGWWGPHDREISPPGDGPGPLADKRVCVLMGPACMSSCESFLLMMRHGARARLIGSTSFGSSGNPKPYDLGHGITVVLPSWVDLDIDGTSVEGRGVTPDDVVPWPDSPGAEEDPVLETGLKWLRQSR